MKRALLTLIAGVALTALTACSAHRCATGNCGPAVPHFGSARAAPELAGGARACPNCGGQGCQACGQHVTPSPVTGAITYPYYTVRGPRDYFATNPSSIGPGN